MRWLVLGSALTLLTSELGCRSPVECTAREARAQAKAQPAQLIARCTRAFEQARDPRAALTVATGYAALGDGPGLLAWAERVGALPGTGELWRMVAAEHQAAGRPQQSVAATERALALWQQAGQWAQAAYEAYLLFSAHHQASHYAPALVAARTAHELAAKSGNPELRRTSFAALFTVLSEVGEYAGAAALVRQWRRELAPEDLHGRRALHISEGSLHAFEGRRELARLAQLDAVSVPGAADDPDSMRAAHYNLVELAVALGRFDEAEHHLGAALAYLPAEPAPYMLTARSYFSAQLALARGQAATAERGLREELARQPLADWGWQLEELLGEALEAQGQGDQALAAYQRAMAIEEQMRGDVGAELLQLSMRERKRGTYEAAFDLLARRGELAGAMAVAQRLWQRAFVESFSMARGGAEASAEAELARVRELEVLASGLPRRAEAAAVDERGPLVLAFVEARGGLWRWTAGRGPAVLERLALSAPEARRLVAELRARPQDAAVAAALGAALLPTSLGAVEPTRKLAVITDGALAGLPVAALRLRGRYLVELRALELWPDLSTGPRETSAPRAVHVLAASRPRGNSARLVAAEAEAAQVAAQVAAQPLIGERATVAALRAAAGGELLHLAAHGGVDAGGAFVELADGRVTAGDVLGWGAAPRLVVLASCASGARPQGSLWGALGGAFLAAGATAVVATLWSVEDEASAELLRELYQTRWREDPAAALAAAQRSAIARGASPRQWAAFVTLARR